MKLEDIEKIAGPIMEAILDGLLPRISGMDKRLSALESKESALCFRGDWANAKSYSAGNLVKHKDLLWHCIIDTTTSPGSSSDWKIVIERTDGHG